MRWLENSYDAFLDFTAHHWWTIVLPSIGLLALTGWMLVERPKAFIPTEDQGYLIASIQTPDGTGERGHVQDRQDASARSRRSWRRCSVGARARRLQRLERDQPDQLGHVVHRPRGVVEAQQARAASERACRPSSRSRFRPRSAAPWSWCSSRRRSAA